MRKLASAVAAVVAVLLLAAAGTPLARAADPSLDRLFERLAAARGAAESQALEAEIWQTWMLGGGPAATSLMRIGVGAMARGDLPAALGVFDAIVRQNPDFAEGWNKRATVLYLMGALDAAATDCERVLRLEPRHFGALSGLGMIRMKQARVEEAIAAFERALALHPNLDGARTGLETLRRSRRDGAI
jgi:tetratricopeptide (TPR) repeat protein